MSATVEEIREATQAFTAEMSGYMADQSLFGKNFGGLAVYAYSLFDQTPAASVATLVTPGGLDPWQQANLSGRTINVAASTLANVPSKQFTPSKLRPREQYVLNYPRTFVNRNTGAETKTVLQFAENTDSKGRFNPKQTLSGIAELSRIQQHAFREYLMMLSAKPLDIPYAAIFKAYEPTTPNAIVCSIDLTNSSSIPSYKIDHFQSLPIPQPLDFNPKLVGGDQYRLTHRLSPEMMPNETAIARFIRGSGKAAVIQFMNKLRENQLAAGINPNDHPFRAAISPAWLHDTPQDPQTGKTLWVHGVVLKKLPRDRSVLWSGTVIPATYDDGTIELAA